MFLWDQTVFYVRTMCVILHIHSSLQQDKSQDTKCKKEENKYQARCLYPIPITMHRFLSPNVPTFSLVPPAGGIAWLSWVQSSSPCCHVSREVTPVTLVVQCSPPSLSLLYKNPLFLFPFFSRCVFFLNHQFVKWESQHLAGYSWSFITISW